MTPRNSLLALIAITVLGCYVILDSFLHHQRDTPNCQMSYSRPSFIPIPVPQSRLASKYTLHLYREGGIDTPKQLLGVPTLFIPGHAGSYKQARSIAAESAYYYQGLSSKNFRYGLDVFTVDLNEEFSAIDGELIQDQAEYLNDAVKQILSFYQPISEYQGRPIPSSVLVVGHSMGGVVARVMQHLPNYTPGSINTIFTLATPHNIPPIILDPTLDTIYHHFLSQPLNDTVLISVAGGTLDTIVNSDAAILTLSSSALTVFTTATPEVWTGCDHMAILWCNQLVKKVAAALVDIIDIRSPSQTVSADDRMRIFRNYLSPSHSVTLDSEWQASHIAAGAVYMDSMKPQYVQPHNGQQLVYSLDKATGDIGIITNIQDPYSSHIRLCKTDEGNLTCLSVKTGFQLLPSPEKTRQTQSPGTIATSPLWLLDLEYTLWKDFDVLVMNYEQGNHDYGHFIRMGTYASTSTTSATLDTEKKFGLSSFWEWCFGKGILLKVDSQHVASVYHLPTIKSPFLAFKLSTATPRKSSDKTYQSSSLVRQSFYGESKFHILPSISHNDNNSNRRSFAPIHFHHGRQPIDHSDPMDTDGLILTIWPLSHDDHYDHSTPATLHLVLEFDWYGSIGKCALRLGPALPMCLFVVALSFLAHQLSALSASSSSPPPPVSLDSSLMDWLIVGKYSLLNMCFWVILATALQQQQEWRLTDWLVSGVYSSLSVALYLLAAGLLACLTVLLSVLIYCLQWLVPRSITTSAPPSPASPWSSVSFLHLHIWIVLISWFTWLPIALIVVIFYLQWLFSCVVSYSSARLSENSNDWIKYRYRFAILVVLTTWLPYHIPKVIVYVRDLMVGWHYWASVNSMLNDVDVIIILGFLYTIGYCDNVWKSSNSMSYLCKLSYGFTLYYTLVGIQHPFTLHHLVTSICSYFTPASPIYNYIS